MRMTRGWLGVVLVVASIGGACSTGPSPEDQVPEFSASRLGDPMEESSIAELLGPEEREAVRRAGIKLGGGDRLTMQDETQQEGAPAFPGQEGDTTADKAGKVGVVLLGLGMTLAAAAAPFFMF